MDGCQICTQVEDVLRWRSGEDVQLGPVLQLIRKGECEPHSQFFNWFFDDSNGYSVSANEKDGAEGKLSQNELVISASPDGLITLSEPRQSNGSCRLYGELFLSRPSGHDSRRLTGRSMDRNWIDVELIKDWISTCGQEHGPSCASVDHYHLPRPQIPWFLDTFNYCLVQAEHQEEYVALSYVWGGSNVLQTTTKTLGSFCQPRAFLPSNNALPWPISNAIDLVRLIGKRYLWVDALCIVQDDRDIRDSLINQMAAVYANAALTIVAADGNNAESGLKGIKGISAPRDNPSVFDWPGKDIQLVSPHGGSLSDSTWNTRGWTFQEYIFSRRRLIFVAETVRWECRQVCLWEEHRESGQLPTAETRAAYDGDYAPIRVNSLFRVRNFPSLEAFRPLTTAYCEREFTRDEDSMDAFLGIAAALSPSFKGGFLWGIPVMFLDICLIWRKSRILNELPFRRRWDPRYTSSPGKIAPTWSWVSWQGRLEHASLWTDEDFVLWSRETWFYQVDSIKRIVPLVRWSARVTKTSLPMEILHQNEWYMYKKQYSGPCSLQCPLPPGWTRRPINYTLDKAFLDSTDTSFNKSATLDMARDKFPPLCYYTHDSTGPIKFSYPVPLSGDGIGEAETDDTEHRPFSTAGGRYLSCLTKRAYLTLDLPGEKDVEDVSYFDLIDPDYHDALGREGSPGRLYSLDPSWIEELYTGREQGLQPMVELVAISLMYRQSSRKRWEEPLGMERPQWCNVLWVEWIDGVAYRKGVGEVKREIWEGREREEVELILG